MNELWPIPSAEALEIVRQVAIELRPQADKLIEEVVTSGRQTTQDPAWAEGTALADLDLEITRTNIERWLTGNIETPGRRITPPRTEALSKYASDLVLRGFTADDIGPWRSAQSVVWSWWLRACLKRATHQDVLQEVIEVSAASITTFTDDAMAALSASVQASQSDLAARTPLQRQATVQLLLDGAPLERKRAEAELSYALTGDHIAGVVWAESVESAPSFELVGEQLMRVVGAHHRLTLLAGLTTAWIWLPTSHLPTVESLREAVSPAPGTHLALGNPAKDLLGFRRSHMDAMAVKRLLLRLGSSADIVRFQDVRLLTMLSEEEETRRFVEDTLGDLAHASQDLRVVVRTFIREQFNASRTAELLFAHRNTIDRRLARAAALLPRPLTENASEVDIALLFVELTKDGPRSTKAG
ncbi:PucR family transcriptional regulator [Streptomyces antnestii]|uniref:PucR family transcriptional regulator n=1 Tax=Streptomyces antnestii TaxID=2494256 RepID=A0A437Q3A1_9ACTN|nr:helix-turn-helix domain-containing protein [Streptomyces sp. San01]RVU29028.1 PucR family transcriptional regulator [Streptomyces sp. San01]